MSPLSHAPEPRPPHDPLWKRLAWMAVIWAGSVAVLGIVAWVIRLWLGV